MKPPPQEHGFKDWPWHISYQTSAPGPDGTPTDILKDFYIPVLARSVTYDRVAGYFRSTSLAAASQGFSAFTKNSGKARLIVGADLDPADVQAILQAGELTSDNSFLSQAMIRELMDYDTWPDDVQCGVHLLAWMVAKEFLDIRVAFRVHGDTGAVLNMSSVADGYVHMKFGILHDAHGNGIYMNGSLNESKTALTLNAENIDVHCTWKGEDNALRLADAEKRFSDLWHNKNSYIKVLSLPLAVKEKLLHLSTKRETPMEINGTSAMVKAREVQPSALEILTFSMVRDAPKFPGGRFVGMETSPVVPWPHQEVVARRLIETWPYSYLMCDEVGLGKTIEAGLVIRSLWLSGIAPRVLIAAPASLTTQWQREMAEKFFLPFARVQGGQKKGHMLLWPHGRFDETTDLFAPSLNIISTGLVVRQPHRSHLEKTDSFDIVLLDEAHYARRSQPTLGLSAQARYNNLFSVLSDIMVQKTRALYMATATPMQLDPVEVYDLMGLIHRIGPFQEDPGLTEWYYELLGKLVDQGNLSDQEWDFLRKGLTDIQRHDPFYDQFIRNAVITPRNRSSFRRWLDRRTIPARSDVRHLARIVSAASPLNRVMLRHTRPLLKIYRDKGRLGARLAQREILNIPEIRLNTLEELCYKDLDLYCSTLKSQIVSHGGDAQKTAMGFYLMFLRLRFASSTYAIYKSLERRLAKVRYTLSFYESRQILNLEELDSDSMEDEDEAEEENRVMKSLLKNRDKRDLLWEVDYLDDMLGRMKGLDGPSSKMNHLLSVLQHRQQGEGRYRQTVIFTRYYETLVDIVKRLRIVDPAMRMGTYSGKGGQYTKQGSVSLVGTAREEIKHLFLNGRLDILVCTDAAAEGLNLQTADLLINFDLPWNPMKLEQRIGRIDRIGQSHDHIQVLNLCYFGTAEEIVYGRLLKRLATAEAVVGSQAFSMVPIDEEEFHQLDEKEISEAEMEARIRERFNQVRTRARNREIPPEELYEIYVNLSETYKRKGSVIDLKKIWQVLSESPYLQAIGCRVLDHSKQIFEINNLPGINDGSLLTTSRETFEFGLGGSQCSLGFATYGVSVFDELVAHVADARPLNCFRRLHVAKTNTAGPMVGYVVACNNGTKTDRYRLLTSFDGLDDIRINGAESIDDEICLQYRDALKTASLHEFENIYVAGRIEKKNKLAAASQRAFNYLLVIAQLKLSIELGHGRENFDDEIKRQLQSCEQNSSRKIPGLPVEPVKKLKGLLYAPDIPNVGEVCSIRVPVEVFKGALAQAVRTANAMHVKKSELSTQRVIGRLKAELDATLPRLSL